MFSNQDIVKYYDLTEFHYRLHWNLKQSRSLHYGYWDDTTHNFHEALLNTNKILADKAGIKATDHVLDAGCGIGGSSLWLAKHIGCRVTGIALNSKQIETGRTLAAGENLDSLVDFQQQDFTATTFKDESFDVIWAIESVCHARDKFDFLQEAYRILKPGGRLIMCDYFKEPDLNKQDSRIIDLWINGWAIDDIPVLSDFQRSALYAGFKNIEAENATAAIIRSSRKMAMAYYLGIIPSRIYNFFHKNVSTHGKNNVVAAYYQYKGLKKGLWKYQVIRAIKQP